MNVKWCEKKRQSVKLRDLPAGQSFVVDHSPEYDDRPRQVFIKADSNTNGYTPVLESPASKTWTLRNLKGELEVFPVRIWSMTVDYQDE